MNGKLFKFKKMILKKIKTIKCSHNQMINIIFKNKHYSYGIKAQSLNNNVNIKKLMINISQRVNKCTIG